MWAVSGLAVALASASGAQAQVAFGPAQDVAVPGPVTGLAVIGPGSAPGGPAGGPSVPVQRIAVVTNGDTAAGAVSVLAVGGGGVVGAPADAPLPPSSGPLAITTGDLDGDGKPELVVEAAGAGVIDVFKVPEAGGPLPPPTSLAAGSGLALAAGTDGAVIADVNGDGPPDLVARNDQGVGVFLGDGTGGFAAPQVLVANADLNGPGEVFTPLLAGAADVNGDGRADVLTSSLAIPGTNLKVWITSASGASTFASSLGKYNGVTVPADVDGDGRIDLASFGTLPPCCSPGGGRYSAGAGVAYGDGAGGFTGANFLLFDLRGIAPEDFTGGLGGAVADIDTDGRPDVIIGPVPSRAGPSVVRVFRNLGGRKFADPVQVPVPGPTDLVAPVDVNRDGAPDLVLGRGSTDQTIAVLQAVPVLGGSGADFGTQPVGADAGVRSLDVANSGVAPASIASAALEGAAAGDFTITGDACTGRVLAAGEHCSIGLGFRASAAGQRAAQLVLSTGGGQSARLPVTGTGVIPAVIGEPPATIASPRVGCVTRPTARRTRLSCGVVLGPGQAPVRIALRLVRARRVRALADVTTAGRVVLRARRPLVAGRYTLVAVAVAADGRSFQVRRAVAVTQ
jgi:VCBS repeat protein